MNNKSVHTVLLIAASYYPQRGGVETHLRHVVAELQRRGRRPIVAVSYATQTPKRQTVDGALILRLPRSTRLPFLWLWRLTHGADIGEVVAIHSHDVYLKSLKHLFPRARRVHTFHGYEGYPIPERAPRDRQYIQSQVDYTFGVGKFIEKWYGTTCDEYIYGGVKVPNKITAAEGKSDAAFWGRLEEDSGFLSYLKGFAAIHRSDPSASMTVVGDGSLRKKGEEYAQRNKLNITFTGSVAEVYPYIAATRLAFVAGYLAILEAQAMGKPVVALYETPIKKDYLSCHPQADKMRIVDSPAEIATAFTAALKTPTSELKTAKAWARKQTWLKIVERYENQYDKAN